MIKEKSFARVIENLKEMRVMVPIKVFGLSGHDKKAGIWAASVIINGKPDIVCFEGWSEFMKLFDFFDLGKIDNVSEDPEWKEILPLLKWYWQVVMSFLEKEEIIKAARIVGAQSIPIDVSIMDRMQRNKEIRDLRERDRGFRMRLWFAYKVFQNVTMTFAKLFFKFPNFMNSIVGKVYFQTIRRMWDRMLPESRWSGVVREEYMARKVLDVAKKHGEDAKIYVFVGTIHKWNLERMIKSMFT